MRRGYRFEPDKFGIAGLTATRPRRSRPARPASVRQLERLSSPSTAAEDDDAQRGRIKCISARIERVLRIIHVPFNRDRQCRRFERPRSITLRPELHLPSGAHAPNRVDRAAASGIGRSEERPFFDGLCPAMTENGMIING